MRKYAAQILALCVLIAIIVAIRLSGADSYLTVEDLRKHKELLEQFIDAHYALSVLVYILVYLVSVAFSVPGATVLTLAGGFLFHLFPGIVYVNVGATLGATFAFLFSRYILGNTIQNKYGVQLERFNRELEENGHLYLLTIRFIPVFPFFLINILSGLTKIRLWTYVWSTSIGILPRVARLHVRRKPTGNNKLACGSIWGQDPHRFSVTRGAYAYSFGAEEDLCKALIHEERYQLLGLYISNPPVSYPEVGKAGER